MLDPIESLAFSIYHNPGVYALLLGSGTSRSAGVPTGWDVTLELISRLSAIRDLAMSSDPETWYVQQFGEQPTYSGILERLAGTSAERQQLLRPFFEADDEERQPGLKQPTAAHQAIASLAAKGYIRVIVTTNFDHLIERALEDAGITPVVLSTTDQVQNATPLTHLPCCVIKLHGDYLDPRSLNTGQELDRYDAALERLLDRVFDEYGLVVCGWSASWDGALRSALSRRANRRYSIFWAQVGDLTKEARNLIANLEAQQIDIPGADEFFDNVRQNVEALENVVRPHPISTAMAVERLKRYMNEPQNGIQMRDLASDICTRAIHAMSDAQIFDVGQPSEAHGTTPNQCTFLVKSYVEACKTLVAMGPIAGYYTNDSNIPVWEYALSYLATEAPGSRDSLRFGWKGFPAAIALYALGMGAVAAQRLDFIGKILRTSVGRENGRDLRAARYLHLGLLFYGMLPGPDWSAANSRGDYVHMSQWLHDELQPATHQLIPNADLYTFYFDKLEILLALSYIYYRESNASYIPFSRFHIDPTNLDQILEDIMVSVKMYDEGSPYSQSGIASPLGSDWIQAIQHFRERVGIPPP